VSSDTGRLEKRWPIACNLSGSEEFEKRRGLVAETFGGCRRVEELANGYAFGFPEGARWANRLVDFVNSKRVRWPFFAFELVFEPDLGPIWLRVRGAEGVKEFIEREFAVPQTG
jgi:hypothetical protein